MEKFKITKDILRLNDLQGHLQLEIENDIDRISLFFEESNMAFLFLLLLKRIEIENAKQEVTSFCHALYAVVTMFSR